MSASTWIIIEDVALFSIFFAILLTIFTVMAAMLVLALLMRFNAAETISESEKEEARARSIAKTPVIGEIQPPAIEEGRIPTLIFLGSGRLGEYSK